MALTRRIGFTRFDRWGDNLGRITATAAKHTDALDGTDELAITCEEDLVKGDRIVWIDLQGVCHEHMVDSLERLHDSRGKPYTNATCISSINETWDDWIDDKRPSGDVSAAVSSVIANTRWELGTCDQQGSASRTFYHMSVREALAGVIETWGGELETTIVHDGAGIVSRRVGVRAERGNQSSAKRFTWTKDLVSVKRTVASDNPKTRVYGYGKGVETESGGYGRRLTFGDINDGKDYVEDAEATAIWGHPDGKGGTLPAVTSYVNEQCEDAAQLLQETKAHLEQVKEPKVTYVASVIDLYAFGRSWEGVGVGDSVAIIDKGFSDEGVRLRGRVSQIERDLITGETTVTFGNLYDAMADMWQSVSSALKSNSQQNALYDSVAAASPGWLQEMQQKLNEQFAASGTYRMSSFELGDIWSNVPLDQETGLPKNPGGDMWAINLNGAGMRIASGLKTNGEWDWSTFGTGEGFTADAITAGVIRGGSSYWNLDTGAIKLMNGIVESEYTTGSGSNKRTFVASLSPTYGFRVYDKDTDETIVGVQGGVSGNAGIVTPLIVLENDYYGYDVRIQPSSVSDGSTSFPGFTINVDGAKAHFYLYEKGFGITFGESGSISRILMGHDRFEVSCGDYGIVYTEDNGWFFDGPGYDMSLTSRGLAVNGVLVS